MRQNNAPIITSASMGADVASSPIDLSQIFCVGIQAVWSGAPTGAIKVQVSIDPGPDPQGPNSSGSVQNWSDVTGSSQSIAGVAGNFYWEFGDISARWMRLVYTRTSGSGTLNARQNLKGF